MKIPKDHTSDFVVNVLDKIDSGAVHFKGIADPFSATKSPSTMQRENAIKNVAKHKLTPSIFV